MDAQRRSVPALAWMAARKRFHPTPVGRLQRDRAALSVGHRLPYASDPGGVVVRVKARLDHLRRVQISERARAALHSPVLARLGGFSGVAREQAAASRLFRKLRDRYARASGFLPGS